MARILANDMLQVFIRSELETLEENRHRTNNSDRYQLNIRLNAKKAEIIEILYGLDTINFFGDISLKRVTAFVEKTFNIELGNISRTFAELKTRNAPMPFLDKIRDFLLKRMGRKDDKK